MTDGLYCTQCKHAWHGLDCVQIVHDHSGMAGVPCGCPSQFKQHGTEDDDGPEWYAAAV